MEEMKNKPFAHHKELFEQIGITLDALTIHQKDFPIKFRGYDPNEVDPFLDDIIKDYSQFYVIISDLLGKYKELKLRERAHQISSVHREQERSTINEPSAINEPSVKDIADIIRRMEQNIYELKCQLTTNSHPPVKIGDDTNTV